MTAPNSTDHAIPTPLRVGRWRRFSCRLASLSLVLEIALGLRIASADAVEWAVHRGDPTRLCLFRDTDSYWELARTLRGGTVRDRGVGGHPSFRAPHPRLSNRAGGLPGGFRRADARRPACPGRAGGVDHLSGLSPGEAIRGARNEFLPLPRGRGTIILPSTRATQGPGGLPSDDRAGSCWTVPLVAAWLAAVNPHYLLMSSLILSEAVFVPLMLASLLGMAVLWPRSATGPASSSHPGDGPPPVGLSGRAAGWKADLVALGTGVSSGAAVLVRPSWVLFIPWMLAAWILASRVDRRRLNASVRGSVTCMIGVVAIMSPWWVRNARVYGRFVPTALWMGASLYDGLNLRASGASDMSFLADPEIWPLDEQDQDAELTRRAVAFARENPGERSRWPRSSWDATGALGPTPKGSAPRSWRSVARSWSFPFSA